MQLQPPQPQSEYLGWMTWIGKQSTKTHKHITHHHLLEETKTKTKMKILMTNSLP
jgi:hypothetical protein